MVRATRRKTNGSVRFVVDRIWPTRNGNAVKELRRDGIRLSTAVRNDDDETAEVYKTRYRVRLYFIRNISTAGVVDQFYGTTDYAGGSARALGSHQPQPNRR